MKKNLKKFSGRENQSRDKPIKKFEMGDRKVTYIEHRSYPLFFPICVDKKQIFYMKSSCCALICAFTHSKIIKQLTAIKQSNNQDEE